MARTRSRISKKRSRRLRWLAEIIARDGDRCLWCSRQLTYDHPDATVEHLHPQNKGGGDELTNLALACGACNSERQSTPLRDWARVCRRRGLTVREQVLAAALERVTVTA